MAHRSWLLRIVRMARNIAASIAAGEAEPKAPRGPIDMVHLGKQTLGDPGLQSEVLRLFDTMSRTYFERLQASSSAQEMLRYLHTLQAAASGVGARAIADLAREAEEELRNGMPVNRERIDDLGVAVQECSVFIAELLADEVS